jgi:hypothetical protein
MTKLKRDFLIHHQKNPTHYELFDQFTRDRIDRGFDHYGSDAILNQIRWHTDQPNPAEGDEFKINNNWSAFYARMWMLDNPYYGPDGVNGKFFRIRHIPDDDLPDRDYYGPPPNDDGDGPEGQMPLL